MCYLEPSQLPRARKVLAELEKLARISQNPLNSSPPLNKSSLKGTIVTATGPLCSLGSWSLGLHLLGAGRPPEAASLRLPWFCPVAGVGGGVSDTGQMLSVRKKGQLSQWQRCGHCLLGLRTNQPLSRDPKLRCLCGQQRRKEGVRQV